MTTQQDLDKAATDALALTRFMTGAAGSQTLNSAGADIGTLEAVKAEFGLQSYVNVDALIQSASFHPVGAQVRLASEGVTLTVVDDATEPHFTTPGGVRLIHPDGPCIIAISGQSNASGSFADGPNPASPLVRVWDGVTSDWGSSDRTLDPMARSNPHGNMGNNNYALARAHRIASDTARPVFVVFDAQGGQSISEWVGNGADSARYAALVEKIEAALLTPVMQQSGVDTVEEIIFAQGEADFEADFATYLEQINSLRLQLRSESWCQNETPIYMMAPSDLHDRYQWRDAVSHLCSQIDTRCVFVSSNGLRTEFSATGSGDNTHFLGESLWEAGYFRIADTFGAESKPTCFYGRGTGPVDATDATAMTTFSTLVSRDSWTTEVPPNGPAATGAISWGFECSAEGNYSFALGYECTTDNLANYGLLAGRLLLADQNTDYFAGFGFQNTISARYTIVTGRGNVAADEGAAIFGMFSQYAAVQTDPVLLQIGNGSSTSNRSNALTVRKSGNVEMKDLPRHANQTDAVEAGLTMGSLYATPSGELRIVV